MSKYFEEMRKLQEFSPSEGYTWNFEQRPNDDKKIEKGHKNIISIILAFITSSFFII